MNLLSSTRYAVAVFSFAGLLAPPLLSVVHGAESSSSRGYPGFGPGIAAPILATSAWPKILA
jgi:hypothetical protein